MKRRRFDTTLEAGGFVVGRLAGEQASGVYLPGAYLARLRDIRRAVAARLSASPDSKIPDALKNLLDVVDRLLDTHDRQIERELPGHITELKKELKAIETELDNLRNEPGAPAKK